MATEEPSIPELVVPLDQLHPVALGEVKFVGTPRIEIIYLEARQWNVSDKLYCKRLEWPSPSGRVRWAVRVGEAVAARIRHPKLRTRADLRITCKMSPTSGLGFPDGDERPEALLVDDTEAILAGGGEGGLRDADASDFDVWSS